MTIASAFNEITVAHGGRPSKGGTIAGAIDALNDTLAGSDQPAANTIEGAIRLLGQHIGTGGGGAAHDIHCYMVDEQSMTMEPLEYELVYRVPIVAINGHDAFDYQNKVEVSSASSGDVIYAIQKEQTDISHGSAYLMAALIGAYDEIQDVTAYISGAAFIMEQSPATASDHIFFMPDCDVTLLYVSTDDQG